MTNEQSAVHERAAAGIGAANPVPGRWPAAKAAAWYAGIDWPVGANFVPSTAINQLEMWQAETFDPETIGRELGWAAEAGMNTMRVFLHDIPWFEDREGFCGRIDRYLEAAGRHGIRTMFVFFDSVWNPLPKSGKQPDPVPGVHNSGWVQSPGKLILADPEKQDALKPYVTGILERYRNDSRVLAWDLFNEPDNSNGGKWGGTAAEDLSAPEKLKHAARLLEKAFAWAREVDPGQPLTAGVWADPVWLTAPNDVHTISLRNSDVISFHTYDGPEITRTIVQDLQSLGRPLICSEYMARCRNSTIQAVLPVFKEFRVGAYQWGLVSGRSQTIYPWDSWEKAYSAEPEPWFHDLFRRDGTPYAHEEIGAIKKLTSRN